MSLPQTVMDDQPPLLRFVEFSIEDRVASISEGRFMYKPAIKVYVRAHGDTKTEVPFIVEGKGGWLDQLKEKVHHNFITQNYYDFCVKSYNRWKEGSEAPIDGTPIKNWSLLSDAQQKNVISANILSIEKLASCNDEALSAIGMGARELKKKAQAWLDADNSTGKAAQKIAALESENESKDARLSDLESKLALLEAASKENKPKRGNKS